MTKALELRDQARSAYSAGDYDQAADLARKAKAELGLIKAGAESPASSQASLPASYTVRLILSERDCLWNIAAYPFVYGDGAKWKNLYEANKTTLKNPDNPDLIYPGQVINIPSIAGETRSGEWKDGTSYPNFKSDSAK